MAISKIVLNNTTQIDLTDTTAVASDVASGKYFYGVDGVKTVGTNTNADEIEDSNTALGNDGTASLSEAITALTTHANETTGASDTTLSDAVGTLVAGYGGGVESTSKTIIGDDTSTVSFPCQFEPDAVIIKRIDETELSNRVFAGFIGLKINNIEGHAFYQCNANTTVVSVYSANISSKNFTYANNVVTINTMSNRPVSSQCTYTYSAIKFS